MDQNKILSKNLNIILINCLIFTLYIIVGIMINHSNQNVITHGTLLLIIYTTITAISIFISKSHPKRLIYHRAVFILFYGSTIITTLLCVQTCVVSIDIIFISVIILLVLTSLLYLPNKVSIPLYLLIVISALLMPIDTNAIVMLIFIAIISCFITHFRYQGMLQKLEDEKTLYELKKMLDHMSSRDTLTNLYNTQYLYEKLKDEIERVLRYPSPLTIVILSIDDFFSINDRCGQVTGDDILTVLANILENSSRTTDIIGRFDETSFMMILPNTPLDSAILLAQRIQEFINHHDFNCSTGITLSIGIKAFDNETYKDMIHCCKDYVALARKTGNNTIHYKK